MSFNPKDYPKNWKEIRSKILDRSSGRCECLGFCGLHCRSKQKRCEEMNGRSAVWAKGIIVLTIAHLCHHKNCSDENHLVALCQRCHLRYDRFMHMKNAAKTRAGKQMELSEAKG